MSRRGGTSVAPAAIKLGASGGASGVSDLRSSIASLADENWWCRPVTSTHTGAGEPVAGVWRGGLGCHWIVATSTRVCVLAEVPPDRRRQAMVASRKGGTSWRSCSSGSAARRDANIQNDNGVVGPDAGLAGRGWGDDCGDGVHVGVLEGAVLLPGRGHAGVAAQRGAHEGRAWAEE